MNEHCKLKLMMKWFSWIMQTCKNPYSFAYLQELSPQAIKNLSIKICRRFYQWWELSRPEVSLFFRAQLMTKLELAFKDNTVMSSISYRRWPYTFNIFFCYTNKQIQLLCCFSFLYLSRLTLAKKLWNSFSLKALSLFSFGFLGAEEPLFSNRRFDFLKFVFS